MTAAPIPDRAETATAAEDEADKAQPLVLVVDDDPNLLFLMAQVLERNGCRVLQAPDAPTALSLCDPNELDLALVDVELPGMDGHGLLQAINDRLVDQYVPVVLVTARALASDVAIGLGLGASDYLRKPFEVSELLARVDAALKIKRLQDRLRQQNHQLASLSRTDTLTGAYNRRHLDEEIAAICRSARRHDDSVAVLMIDVDHFKRVNDTHGHRAGDEVLKIVVRRLQAKLRSHDTFGRWGGEEFLVLLPRTDHPGAVTLAERLRAAVADEPFPVGDGEPLRVTVSIGIACDSGPDPDELITAADGALYDAKEAGRNRVASH